jgi:hypothetical protein
MNLFLACPSLIFAVSQLDTPDRDEIENVCFGLRRMPRCHDNHGSQGDKFICSCHTSLRDRLIIQQRPCHTFSVFKQCIVFMRVSPYIYYKTGQRLVREKTSIKGFLGNFPGIHGTLEHIIETCNFKKSRTLINTWKANLSRRSDSRIAPTAVQFLKYALRHFRFA